MKDRACIWCGKDDSPGESPLVPFGDGWLIHGNHCLKSLREGEALKAANDKRIAA